MTKGIRYSETFAATPREDTSMIFSAVAMEKDLERKTGDVEKSNLLGEFATRKTNSVEATTRLEEV